MKLPVFTLGLLLLAAPAFAQPKPVKPPKIKEPKIIVPQVPNVPVPIGSGGQQTQRRPGGVILS